MSGQERSPSAASRMSRSDGVLAVDLDGKVTYVNRATELMTGQGRGGLLDHPLAFLLKVVGGTLAQRLPGVTGGGPAHDPRAAASDAWVLDRRESQWIPIEFSAKPIHDRDGAIVGAIIVFRELNCRRHA